MFISSKLIAALMGASMVNAHMIMSSPVPYSKDSLNNSPLAADGSDFPCKLRDNAFEAPSTETIIAIGESYPLTFIGSATHGGGSCQISLTTDLEPSKTSDWKVIKSFEGGCPANVAGNLVGGADLIDPYSFNFTIPDGITAGKYTLAWTWFNRVGNREMYMNCAPITVSGTSSKRSTEELEKRTTSFPPMFVANINGDYVEYDGDASNLAEEGSAACTGTATFGGSGDTASSGSSSASTESTSTTAVAESTSTIAAAESTSTAAAVTSVASVPTATSSSTPTEPEPVSSSAVAPASATSSSTTTSSSSSGTLTGTCSTEGEWNCISGTSFQRCASGTWSAVQQMATGTQCSTGQSMELDISSTMKARHISSMRFRKRNYGSHHV
ncbi:unnamed protein product [Penicillium glandicola]